MTETHDSTPAATEQADQTHKAEKTDRADKADKADKPTREKPQSPFPSPSQRQLRVQLGIALQRHRLRRGLTQGQLAEFADLSLKYVGEIERGEANTTLEAIERLAEVIGWNPMDALDGAREPITEGVRLLLVGEVGQMADRLRIMTQWLEALDPGKNHDVRLPAGAASLLPDPSRKRARSRARVSKRRKRGNR